MNFFKTKYRIVTDAYCGYEVQYKSWWWPFWIQAGFTNTHLSIEQARKYIEVKCKIIVEEYNPHFNTKKQ